MGARDLFVSAAMGCIGAPYIYGGNDPETGIDCSGVVCYSMCKTGVPFSDHGSATLARIFGANPVSISEALPGSLFFYGDSADKISHVMVAVRRWPNGTIALVGARGGDRLCTSYDDAARRHAFVDCVLGDYWHSRLRLIAEPFKGEP